MEKSVNVFDDSVRGAFDAYLGGCGFSGRLFRKAELRGRPRFILCGKAGGGKTSLLVKAGLRDMFFHTGGNPSASGGAPAWLFCEKAVYIDVPGALFADPKLWGALCASLKKNRYGRKRAVDGVLLVVDIRDILYSNAGGGFPSLAALPAPQPVKPDGPEAGAPVPSNIKRLAAGLRKQVDALVSATGYKVPVYFIFTKCDAIPGFNELFSDSSATGSMRAAGSLIRNGKSGRPPFDTHSGQNEAAGKRRRQPVSPYELFSSHSKMFRDDLIGQCLLKLSGADITAGGGAKAVCRLIPEFTLAESGVSAFAGEFFAGGGSAVFPGGLFFTSAADEPRLSALLGGVIPGAKFKAGSAAEGTRGYRLKRVCCLLLIITVWLTALFATAGGALRDALFMRSLRSELASVLDEGPSLEDRFAALERLRVSYDYLRPGVRTFGRIIFRTDGARGAVGGVYASASKALIAGPAARRLEMSMAETAGAGPRAGSPRPSELTVDEHRLMYHTLEAYLVLTGGSPAGAAIDTASVAGIVASVLKGQYESIDGNIMEDNIRAVIRFAAGGRYGASFDAGTVNAARERLAHAPRAGTVYRAVMDRLLVPRRAVPMEQVIGKGEILRYGREVSVLYTREGWERTVFPELAAASKDPFKSDWVMGPVDARFDGGGLLEDLSALYAKDLISRWLDFVRNVVVNLPANVPQLAHDLDRLSSRESEIGRMLSAVCSIATQLPEDSGREPSKDIKSKISGLSDKLRGGRQSGQDTADPFEESKKIFGAIETFLTGGPFDGYRKALGEISEALKDCADRGGFAAAFSGRADDPVRQCRVNLAKSYTDMPHELSTVLKRVLEAPLNRVEPIVTKAASAEIGSGAAAWFEEPDNRKKSGDESYRLRF